MTDPYLECLDWLYSRLNYERQGMPRIPGELRLGRMRRLLRRTGDPQDAFPIVHVAGTKGKGSTSVMTASAFTASGVRTGLFCSPHLHRVEERFSIDGRPATEEELVGLVEALRPVVAEIDAEGGSTQRGPTFFEVSTAMGLLHFARCGVGLVVLEVGLGGRLDSTNAVRPAVSVITNISFDHTRLLGNTLAAIAREKAGIIKRGRPVVSGEGSTEAGGVIREVARLKRAPIAELGYDFAFEYDPPIHPLSRPEAGSVRVRTARREWPTLRLPLFGAHQARNAAVTLATLDTMAELGMEAGPESVTRAFAELRWPARVEVLGESPWLVVDGAHNVASAGALAETLQECFPPSPRTLVFGTTRDKDLKGQLQALLPGTRLVVATRYVENPRAVDPADVAEAVRSLSDVPVRLTFDPAEALAVARSETPADGLLCVTGSLFLAAETRALILGLGSEEAATRGRFVG